LYSLSFGWISSAHDEGCAFCFRFGPKCLKPRLRVLARSLTTPRPNPIRRRLPGLRRRIHQVTDTSIPNPRTPSILSLLSSSLSTHYPFSLCPGDVCSCGNRFLFDLSGYFRRWRSCRRSGILSSDPPGPALRYARRFGPCPPRSSS
jgi:hypothetical protein